MNAGAYKEKITIEKSTMTSDAIGNHLTEWLEYYSGYSYVNNLSGSEYYEAAQTQSQETVMFILRYNRLLDGMDSKNYRVVFRGHYYNIIGVDNVQYKNQTIKLRCLKESR